MRAQNLDCEQLHFPTVEPLEASSSGTNPPNSNPAKKPSNHTEEPFTTAKTTRHPGHTLALRFRTAGNRPVPAEPIPGQLKDSGEGARKRGGDIELDFLRRAHRPAVFDRDRCTRLTAKTTDHTGSPPAPRPSKRLCQFTDTIRAFTSRRRARYPTPEKKPSGDASDHETGARTTVTAPGRISKSCPASDSISSPNSGMSDTCEEISVREHDYARLPDRELDAKESEEVGATKQKAVGALQKEASNANWGPNRSASPLPVSAMTCALIVMYFARNAGTLASDSTNP